MNFSYSLKQKTKVAILLFAIMVCTLLVRVLEDRSIKEMGKSFTSLHNDRLIPATDLFFLLEQFTAKKEVLANHITDGFRKENKNAIVGVLKNHNQSIDSLLKKYEQTYLVTNEKDYLASLKRAIANNRMAENTLVGKIDYPEASELMALKTSYHLISKKLSELTQLQSKIGEQLINESKAIAAGSSIYSTVQFILAIVIGVLIVSIMVASNVIQVKQEKFNLN